MKSIFRTLGWVVIAALGVSASAAAKPGYGTISGVVLDSSGTPQMGASVWLISEDGGRIVAQLLSNQHGAFLTDHLKPGIYDVRVSVAGFLPAMEHHVAVMADLTTLLRVQLDTLFSSLDTLRRKPDVHSEQDDWKWVLRSSAATRTILQWDDSGSAQTVSNTAGGDSPNAHQRPRALVRVGNGAMQPGSASNFPNTPATAVSYDQQIGKLGRVLVAGQMGYDKGASGSFASVWLPLGEGNGPETIFIWRQSKIGAEGMEFQGMRIDHTEQLELGDHLQLKAGAEYLRAGIISSTSSLRPHVQFNGAVSPDLTLSLIVAANPPSEQWGRSGTLESAIDELNSLPPVLFHNGRPVLEAGWHQELSAKRRVGSQSTIEVAAFHDSSRDQAIFGNGGSMSPEFVQDEFSSAFLYDGGNSSSWGTRVAYRQKLSKDWEVAAIYSWAGALSAPGAVTDLSPAAMRDDFTTSNHHSVAGRVSGKISQTGTQFSASYKWVAGTALTRMDQFGEAEYQMDPNLHISIRQQLPGLNGRWEALADFSNLLAQGYVGVNGQDPRMVLAPILRSFRGGVSFQF